MNEEKLYLNDEHDVVSKDQATWLVIHKLDDEKLVEEIWVDLKAVETSEMNASAQPASLSHKNARGIEKR